MLKKNYLLTPGPTPIPERVLSVLGSPIPHHRTPAYQAVFAEVRKGLQRVFKTDQPVLTLATSGTGAMDASVCNLFSPGDEVLVIVAGKFGERWVEIAVAYGLTVSQITLKPGEAFDPSILKAKLSERPQIKGVLFQATETSTGYRLPVDQVCEIARPYQALTLCDAITACGVYDLPMDQLGLDVLLTGSQKAFMIPPGLAMLALSSRAWEAAKKSTLPKYYLDLNRERQAQIKNDTPFTPSISLVCALRESLKMMEEEGLEELYKRHDLLARATRSGVKALGLEIVSACSPSSSVTAVWVPESLVKQNTGKLIPKIMRDELGVAIAGGQDELEGKIFRLSHFGYCAEFDVTTALSALELTLYKLGYSRQIGAGVSAALQTFAEAK